MTDVINAVRGTTEKLKSSADEGEEGVEDEEEEEQEKKEAEASEETTTVLGESGKFAETLIVE